MKTVYIVFTVVDGYPYIVCNDNEKVYVKRDPSDDEVAQFPDKAMADGFASRNSNTKTTYKVKPIEIPG